MTSSWFADVKVADPIEVFLLNDKCKEDNNPDKVNLGVGGKPYPECMNKYFFRSTFVCVYIGQGLL